MPPSLLGPGPPGRGKPPSLLDFDGPPSRGMPGNRGGRRGPRGRMGPGPRFDRPPLFDGPLGRFPGPRFDGPMDMMDDFDGPPDMFDGPPGRFDGPPGMFDGPPGMFDGPPGMFDGPRGRFNGPRGRFNGPRGRFGGPRGPPPFGRPFDGRMDIMDVSDEEADHDPNPFRSLERRQRKTRNMDNIRGPGGDFSCRVCDVTVSNEHQLERHMQSRKHKNNHPVEGGDTIQEEDL